MLNHLLNRDSSSLSASVVELRLNEWLPIINLPKRHQDEILNRSEVVEYAPGNIVFMNEDDDEKDFYLLEGSIEFVNSLGEQVQFQEHSGQKSLELLDHHKPRVFTARAKQHCKVFVTRRTFFNTLNSASGGEQKIPELDVSEIDMEGSGNWMLHLLNSSVFSMLPPENLQQIFISMESIRVPAGTSIVEQGELGEYFYLLQDGECLITHRNDKGEKKKLAKLSSGETFGERSLLSEEPSDVEIEMLTNSFVMRIHKDSFDTLVKEYILSEVSIEKASLLVNEGAVWIDVRNPEQYKELAIKNSFNMDLNKIYTGMKGLSVEKKYILCGDSKSDAMASAFMLSVNGFSVYSLTTSVHSYLDLNSDSAVNIQQATKMEVSTPVLETTLDVEEVPLLADIETFEETEDNPPQIRINPESVIENLQALSSDFELQMRKEINDLYILKQKELEKEVDIRFKKYHLATAQIMKKKLDDLGKVYSIQSKLSNKTQKN